MQHAGCCSLDTAMYWALHWAASLHKSILLDPHHGASRLTRRWDFFNHFSLFPMRRHEMKTNSMFSWSLLISIVDALLLERSTCGRQVACRMVEVHTRPQVTLFVASCYFWFSSCTFLHRTGIFRWIEIPVRLEENLDEHQDLNSYLCMISYSTKHTQLVPGCIPMYEILRYEAQTVFSNRRGAPPRGQTSSDPLAYCSQRYDWFSIRFNVMKQNTRRYDYHF